jgi:predicted lipoprotein with Yx(FWY)xxD motif
MESQAMVRENQSQDRAGGQRRLALFAAGAILLAISAGMHLDLYLTGYRTIPTIGPLFLLQVIAGFVLAAAVVVTRSRLVAAAAAGFALSTLGGYLLSIWVGLFGFTEVRTTAGIVAGVIEVAAFTALGLAAVLPGGTHQAVSLDSRGTRILAWLAKLTPAVAVVAILALALLGTAAATASGSPVATAGATATLETGHANGVTVLTNAKGLTLYWFAPDTPVASKCTGSCAAYWPPVTGKPTAGAGVTGKLGAIKRPGGAIQATYNGHPLYTYIGDHHPGQANGNNLNLNGGLWHEVPVSG